MPTFNLGCGISFSLGRANGNSATNALENTRENSASPRAVSSLAAGASPETTADRVAGKRPKHRSLLAALRLRSPSRAESASSAVSIKNDEVMPKALSFDLIRRFSYIQTSTDDTNVESSGPGIVFSRSKDEIGGTDLGMLGKVDGKEVLIKTGLGRGLFKQIANHFVDEDMHSAEKKAGFIVGDYLRMTGTDGNQKKPLQSALFKNLKIFFESSAGKKILAKAREKKFDISDANEIYTGLVAQDKSLKNVLGVPILMDVINGTAGQKLVNDYQKTYLEDQHIPTAELLLVGNNPLIGSEFLADAVPLDKFLAQTFLPEGRTLDEVRKAAKLMSKAGKGEAVGTAELVLARTLISEMTEPGNLEKRKATLVAQLKEEGLEGLFGSVLMRLTMGEKADLGPDNMLVVKGKNGQNQVVSIDITGFRYDRENDF